MGLVTGSGSPLLGSRRQRETTHEVFSSIIGLLARGTKSSEKHQHVLFHARELRTTSTSQGQKYPSQEDCCFQGG